MGNRRAITVRSILVIAAVTMANAQADSPKGARAMQNGAKTDAVANSTSDGIITFSSRSNSSLLS
jgi:hypothetical protein